MRGIGLLLLSVAGTTGCVFDSAGPDLPVARFAVTPEFGGSGVAGIVDIARTRVRLARADGNLALDTVITVPAGADSVTLVATVTVQVSNEAFQLTAAFITPAGDTAFRGGPVEVRASARTTPAPVALPTVYVGVGAKAAGVRITSQVSFIPFNGTVTLTAEAFDAQTQVIPNTPIAWSSLDPTLATVPDPRVGTVQGKSSAGNARIVAALLTGPADTLVATVGAQATGQADYQFQNTRASSVGNPPGLTDIGTGNAFGTETVRGAPRTVLQFPQGNGLGLTPTTGVIPSNIYTIVVFFRFATVSGYRRILDFNSGSSDAGLYNLSSELAYFPVATGSGTPIQADVYVQVALTRDAAGNVTGYVNGLPRFSFVDTDNLAVIDANNALTFFKDDDIVAGEESAGAVARIRLFNRALSAAEILALESSP